MQRQQIRRVARIAKKRLDARRERGARQAVLETLRACRVKTVVQGPGSLAPLGRKFKKPKGQANWRVKNVRSYIGGVPVDVEFHTTKGARRWTVAA
jgi:hypothetical protein